jgi:hypothetical protein
MVTTTLIGYLNTPRHDFLSRRLIYTGIKDALRVMESAVYKKFTVVLTLKKAMLLRQREDIHLQHAATLITRTIPAVQDLGDRDFLRINRALHILREDVSFLEDVE